MADLHVSPRQVGEVMILDLWGKMSIGEGSVTLRRNVEKAESKGFSKLILNFNGADLAYIDSSGIGELVSSLTFMKKLGGSLKILRPSKKIQDVLAITRLITCFDIYETEEAALESFNA